MEEGSPRDYHALKQHFWLLLDAFGGIIHPIFV